VIIGVERYRQFVTSTVLAAAVSVVWIGSCSAQTQDSTAHEQSPAESESAAEASKQAANPLASVWLMQFQQNNTWIGMPANGENRVQSNLQFQPLMSLKLTDDWSLVTRPVLTLFNTTPFQDQTGKDMRVTAFGDTTLALAVSPGHRLVGSVLLGIAKLAGAIVLLLPRLPLLKEWAYAGFTFTWIAATVAHYLAADGKLLLPVGLLALLAVSYITRSADRRSEKAGLAATARPQTAV
jgi:hypothetical protein